MKTRISILCLLLSSCGEFNYKGPYTCSVVKHDTFSIISCPDGSSSIVQDGAPGSSGSQGNPGNDGTNGSNGHSIAYTTVFEPSCANGGNVILLSVDINDNGQVDITDSNLQSVTICNGTNGQNGADGEDGQPTQFTPVGIIDPCGDSPGVYDEVFLKLQNGTLLASFSDDPNGKNTRFSILTTGNYITTDSSHCYFTVDNTGNLINEHY